MSRTKIYINSILCSRFFLSIHLPGEINPDGGELVLMNDGHLKMHYPASYRHVFCSLTGSGAQARLKGGK